MYNKVLSFSNIILFCTFRLTYLHLLPAKCTGGDLLSTIFVPEIIIGRSIISDLYWRWGTSRSMALRWVTFSPLVSNPVGGAVYANVIWQGMKWKYASQTANGQHIWTINLQYILWVLLKCCIIAVWCGWQLKTRRQL